MLGKIEEMSKETKDLASSTKDIRPAMATARFQPVSQRKQRGRMKKLVKLIKKQMLSFGSCLSFNSFNQLL